MNHIKEGIKRLSSNKRRKSKAAFVSLEESENDKFKYKYLYPISNYTSGKITQLRDKGIRFIQGIQLQASKVDWIVLRNDLGQWSFEVSVEGFTANFATHFLFGIPFTPWTILAHGIVIQQGVNLYWRLRNNGEHTKIPQKDK